VKIVFTNGCFDIYHNQHVILLEFCRFIAGDGRVIVGLNSDKSIQKIKGPDRPITPQDQRFNIIKSNRNVDQVLIFNEETPYNLIKRIQPDIIVKGKDWYGREVIGSDICEVMFAPTDDSVTTTKIIQKCKEIKNDTPRIVTSS